MRTIINQEVRAYVNADYVIAFPAVPVVYDNQPFDYNNAPDLYITLEVKPYAGRQISLGSNKTRMSGFIYVTAWVKEGDGTAEALLVLDWMEDKLGYAKLGITQVEAPSPDEGENLKGWHTESMKFAFYADKP